MEETSWIKMLGIKQITTLREEIFDGRKFCDSLPLK